MSFHIVTQLGVSFVVYTYFDNFCGLGLADTEGPSDTASNCMIELFG